MSNALPPFTTRAGRPALLYRWLLVAIFLLTAAGCGSAGDEDEQPVTLPDGPALVMAYTDN